MRGTNIFFRDVLFLMVLGFALVIMLLLPHLNEDKDEEIASAGAIVVEVVWDANIDTDVDTYVATPIDAKPIYFSNKQNSVASLVRDDVGFKNEEQSIPRNDEFVFVRQAVDGLYIVGIRWFGNYSQYTSAVRVDYKVSYIGKDGKIIKEGTWTLGHVHEEYTIVQFSMVNGRPDMNSLSEEQVSLHARSNPSGAFYGE